MLSEQKIRVFLSLANTLNFSETANQLFLTQQSVSKHISQLEEYLGFPLFTRTTHSVKLTPAGERARAFFGEEVGRISGFIEGERQNQLRLSRSIRIGYNDWLGLGDSISAAYGHFHSLYPDISHIPERQPPDVLQSKLLSGELDIILVLRRFLQSETGLKIMPLSELPMTIIINKDHPLASQPVDLGGLSALPLLINSFAAESFHSTVRRAKREAELYGLSNKTVSVLPNRDSIYTAIETGEGIAMACASSMLSGKIAKLPTDVSDTLVGVCLDSNRRKLVREYMLLLKEAFEN